MLWAVAIAVRFQLRTEGGSIEEVTDMDGRLYDALLEMPQSKTIIENTHPSQKPYTYISIPQSITYEKAKSRVALGLPIIDEEEPELPEDYQEPEVVDLSPEHIDWLDTPTTTEDDLWNSDENLPTAKRHKAQ